MSATIALTNLDRHYEYALILNGAQSAILPLSKA